MRNLILLITSLLFLLLTGCGRDSASGYEEGDLLQSGIASWYGPGFHGKITSSRERYDQQKLTAAHRTLPFGTVVKVVNSDNGKAVEVRINDRGPYERNRIIDLSRAAADEIEMLHTGISEVKLILVEAGGLIPEDLNQPTYTIQMGEYNRLAPAERFAESIGEGVHIEQRFPRGTENVVYMIYYGSYKSIGSAQDDLNKLNDRGFDGLIRQIN